MRTTFRCVLALCLLASWGLAEDVIPRTFALCDVDGDSAITQVELQEVAARYEEESDQATSEAQWLAIEDKYDVLPDVETFVLADTDDDRRLTPAELRAYLEADRPSASIADCETLAAWQTERNWPGMAGQLDTDGDGAISLEELRTGEPDADEELFRAIDGNADSKIEKPEMLAFIKADLMTRWGVSE